jgi:hypothetical protein
MHNYDEGFWAVVYPQNSDDMDGAILMSAQVNDSI